MGSFDKVTQGAGHQGLADSLAITDTSNWRGFVVDSRGKVVNLSHFNQPDKDESGNSLKMRDESFQQVKESLRQAGLIP